jgi:molybdopterin synthase sulfur carrier subunit
VQDGGVPTGTIRYWAAAREAAGVTEEPYDATTLAQALAAAAAGRDDRFRQVLHRCSYVVDGDPVGTREHDVVSLREGGTVEVLPPFAGG